MSGRTPWIVLVTNETPANVSRSKCLRCGDMSDVALPLATTAWVALIRAFLKRHANCKEQTP